MTWKVDFILFFLATIAAVVSLRARDLITSVVTLSIFSFLIALLYCGLGAVDVAFNEAVIGAGISGVFLVFMIAYTTRRSLD